MINTRPSSSEVVRRGESIYNESLRFQVESDNFGRYIVIDIDSREYRIGDDHRATVQAFLAERPDAILYPTLIGYSSAAGISGRMPLETTTRAC